MDHALPIQVSANGRYFVDRDGQPFFWLGDTQWNLFRCHDFSEARLILDDRRAKGFSAVQVMGLGWGRHVQAGPVFGEAFPDQDLTKPNTAYFAHVDQVVEYAGQIDMILATGLDHPALRLTNLANARAYGRWVGQRYQRHAHLIWIPTYIIPDQEHLPVMRELVAGLREGGGKGLCSSHPDPAKPTVSSSIAHHERWLAFNSIQTFKSTSAGNISTCAGLQRNIVFGGTVGAGAPAGLSYSRPPGAGRGCHPRDAGLALHGTVATDNVGHLSSLRRCPPVARDHRRDCSVAVPHLPIFPL